MTDMEMGLVGHIDSPRPSQPGYGGVLMATIPAVLILATAAALIFAVL
ncbi:hypothetical protein [Devosia sp.]|nr:hypothetical protein [Devosia sp.]